MEKSQRIRVEFMVPTDLHKRLETYAKDTGKTEKEVAEQAIIDYYKKSKMARSEPT
jgi:predicted transcriptional regulator